MTTFSQWQLFGNEGPKRLNIRDFQLPNFGQWPLFGADGTQK